MTCQNLLERLSVPRRQVVEPIDLVIGQAVQEIGDIGLGIEVTQLCGLDDGHDGGCIFCAAVGAGEGPIASSDDKSPFILPMSGMSWEFITAGIPIMGTR